jgi:hypothetical protein
MSAEPGVYTISGRPASGLVSPPEGAHPAGDAAADDDREVPSARNRDYSWLGRRGQLFDDRLGVHLALR